MKDITQQQLDQHALWLQGTGKGKQLTLRAKNLSGLYLDGRDLRQVVLIDCNLNNCNLSGTNLSRADLTHTRFRGANLSGASSMLAHTAGCA